MVFNKHFLQFVAFFILLDLISCSHPKTNKVLSPICFEEGDIIFRKGTGAKSRAVLHADSTGVYSHCGIVVSEDSVYKVIHITPGERTKNEKVDKIKIEPIDVFWRKDRAEKGALYRLKDNSLGGKAALQAKRLLAKGILFDHDYVLSDSARMYCTELVWYVYQLEGKDISCSKRSIVNMPFYGGVYILPSDIYDNKDILLIYKF